MESKRSGIMITRKKRMTRGEANFIREDAYGLVSD